MNLDIALRAISGNRLRSALTVSLIAVGITALIGIQTSIEVLSSGIEECFGHFGEGAFTISSSSGEDCPPLTYDETVRFRNRFDLDASVSVSSTLAVFATAESSGKVTDPVVSLVAVEGEYLKSNALKLDSGRYFTPREEIEGENVCLIGSSVRDKLFPDKECSSVTVCGVKYRVVGVTGAVGSLFGGMTDNTVAIPMVCAVKTLLSSDADFRITVLPPDDSEEAQECSGILISSIRRSLSSDQKNPTYEISGSDALSGTFGSLKSKLSAAAALIGLVTLFGAAIGLMNIMLVSVRERTHEIGIRRAVGASSEMIARQFLIESIVIGQIGGTAGMVLGITLGNMVALYMDSSFAVPWMWLAVSVGICMAVSLSAGSLPARRAASLNPIDALRHD